MSPSSAPLGVQEPGFQWAFKVNMPGLSAIGLYVSTVNFPTLTWETTDVPYLFTVRRYASRCTIGEINLTVKDFVSADIASKIYIWWKSVGDPQTGRLNAPETYKKDGSLE
jgi:hypothetical protein